MEIPTRTQRVQALLSELGGREITSSLTSNGRLRWWVVRGHKFIVQERQPDDVEVFAPLVETNCLADLLAAIRERFNQEGH